MLQLTQFSQLLTKYFSINTAKLIRLKPIGTKEVNYVITPNGEHSPRYRQKLCKEVDLCS